ncbi:MAG: GNAT family N-acetyltransferase [Calothrix sp. C42_A2020_038]|nr:GNAT family N-acetyltransferase [Calothrix sp. C42_A2020_038]
MCVQFRADSFVCSFGSADRFHEEDGNGAERYLLWLKQRIAEIPNSCVHIWKGEQIIGQMEMRRWKHNPRVGYINLFYLIPKFRGQGLGQQLDQYAANWFKQLGCQSARLSVSPMNLAAMRFYLKQGWIDLGPREDALEVHYFEKTYEADER